jgi:NitT/TauT family transport system permease protein
MHTAPADSGHRAGSRRKQVAQDLAPPLFALFALLALWQGAVVVFAPPRYLLPAPTEIVAVSVRQLPVLLRDAQVTTVEVVIAFVCSLVVGIAVGVAGARSRFFGSTVYPLLVASQSFPKLAIAPLFTVWFGFGLAPKVAMAFLIAFFPIVVNTAVGLRSVDPEALMLARSVGLGSTATFLKIELPAAAPSIFGGLKIASTFSVIGAVVGEFVSPSTGLGHLTQEAAASLNTPLLFGALAALTLLGLVAYGLVALAERLLIPWHVPVGEVNPTWTV